MFGDFLDHEAAIGSVFIAIPCATFNLLIYPFFVVILQASWKYPVYIYIIYIYIYIYTYIHMIYNIHSEDYGHIAVMVDLGRH